jgi:hypothetical protein
MNVSVAGPSPNGVVYLAASKSRYCQDDHIQKRTLFKPNDCVVHPEAHELLSLLIDISKNPILFISCSVHYGPLVC